MHNVYSLGMSIDKFEMLTTDSNWENEQFADRIKNKHLSVYKKIELVNLSLYWNSNEMNFISKFQTNLNPENIIDQLQKNFELVNKNMNIIQISLQALLEQKKLNQKMIEKKEPTNKCQIKIQNIKINWRRQQMIQLQNMLNLAAKYKIFINKQKTIKQLILFRPINKWKNIKNQNEQ